MSDAQNDRICDEMSAQIIVAAERIAMTEGAQAVTVRKILQALHITNRVFYNRFGNAEEVLEIVYRNTIAKIRDSIAREFDPEGDFFAQVLHIVTETLRLSYENKMQFSQYVFENDSSSQSNYEWWRSVIVRLMQFGKEHGYLKDVDNDRMSYSIWCFIRGYNADAIGRGVPMEKAIADFSYSFGILLDGMRA